MATTAITPDQNSVVGEIFIAAPPERVFQAISDPKQMPLWWGRRVLGWLAGFVEKGETVETRP
jgi:uncharacterized protein YndB with AHSA1/START domain